MNWFIGILLITVVILGFLLWKGHVDLTKINAIISLKVKTNDSLKRSIVTRDSADKINALMRERHDSVEVYRMDSLTKVINHQKDSLITAKKKLQALVDELGSEIDSLNDPVLKSKYDSVNRELQVAYALVGDYSNSNDTTIRLLGSELTYKDSTIATLLLEITDLKKGLTTSVLNFDGLKGESDKLEAKIKKQNIITKIGTTLGLILGILVGHSIK
jgi:hypothetical protein